MVVDGLVVAINYVEQFVLNEDQRKAPFIACALKWGLPFDWDGTDSPSSAIYPRIFVIIVT